MTPHGDFNINWINAPCTNRKVAGVYLIEDFYIGASNHIRRRILSHLYIAYKRNSNKDFYKNLYSHYEFKNCLNVEILSFDPFDEYYFIDEFRPFYNQNAKQMYYHQTYKNVNL